MARREFSKSTKTAALERCRRCCELCGVGFSHAISPEYDHRVPDALDGLNDLENCQVVCRTCHRLKTLGEDRPRITKAQRLDDKHMKLRSKSRPMPGSRRSPWRKKMDGTVERRK